MKRVELKLVSVASEPRRDIGQAKADFRALNQQDGSLGGGVESSRLMETEAALRGYDTVHYAVVFMLWPAHAPIPLGCAVATRKMAAKFGVKVPRGVDA